MKKKHKTKKGYKVAGKVKPRILINKPSLPNGEKTQTVVAKARTIEIEMPDGTIKIIKLPRTSFGGSLVKKGGKIK